MADIAPTIQIGAFRQGLAVAAGNTLSIPVSSGKRVALGVIGAAATYDIWLYFESASLVPGRLKHVLEAARTTDYINGSIVGVKEIVINVTAGTISAETLESKL